MVLQIVMLKQIYLENHAYGGLVGYSYKNWDATNCYWSGTATTTSSVKKCGGLLGNYGGGTVNITNCYYNSSSVPISQTNYGTGLSTSQFGNQSNFTGWDFTNTWIMKDGYPEIRIFQ